MAYFICEVKTQSDREAEVTALLENAGASGVSAEGAPLVKESIEKGNAEIWDESQVSNADDTLVIKGFFPADEKMDELKEQLTAVFVLSEMISGLSVTYDFYVLEDEVWQDGWKQYYKPFRVGERLVIKPTWEEYVPEEKDLVIELDPGLAFGTGNHPTTNGALRLLEKHVEPGMKVIDCGCGSGILAVAAGILGASKVFAVDIDHEAILASVRNIRLNHLMEVVDVSCNDVTKKDFSFMAPFQIVVANIVADVIIPMLPSAAKLTEKGGILIAGGIISHRKEEVFAALKEYGFEIKEILTEGEWVTLSAERM
ncbi:MAG: 50S ribosomal protein L11 methyltransferase [Firmicutes bacterium]|nr:50S ribosomal protein L11 methyltransferase [Bacillota bacterium]